MATANYNLSTYSKTDVTAFGDMIDSVLGASNSNMTKIDTALGGKPDKVTPAVANNVAVIDSDGDLADGGVTIAKLQAATNELTASTDLVDADYIPFYDTGSTVHKKSLFSNIISKIRTALFGVSSGLLKANGSGTISAAVSGTDYSPASHSHAEGDLPNASTSAQGVVQLSDSTSETSSVKAATPTAVKSAYDLANAALPKGGGTMTGDVIGHADTDYTTARFRNVTLSTSDASGGSNGDVWIKYTA